MDCSTPVFPVHPQLQSLLKLMSIESVILSNHLILCRPLLLLPSIFPSIRVFSYESVLHIRWPKYWSFSFSISPSNEYLGLISFRMDWLDLLAVQGTLKSLLQHHSSDASILQHSAFFIVQLSHPYMATGKTIALTRQTFVGKVCLCCLFNMLPMFVIAFLPRSKHLFISWLQSLSAMILEPPKYKACHCFHCFPQLLAMKWGDRVPWSSFFESWVLSQIFTLLFHFHQEALEFFFTFCHKGGVIYISEVIDVSAGNLDFSLCFIQPSVAHDILCIEVK